jgi:hypothetical protein
MVQLRIVALVKCAQHADLVLHTESIAGLLKELAGRVHLLCDEHWRLRAELDQEVEQLTSPSTTFSACGVQ